MKTILDYADLVKEQHALNTTIAPVETDLTSASKTYAVGQKFIHDGVLYQAKTPIAQGAALVLNTNYEAADDVSSEIQTLTNEVKDMNNVLGAKNLLPFSLAKIKAMNTEGTWTDNVLEYRGVTYTFYDDGSIKVNGTATASNYLFIINTLDFLEAGKSYTLNGCPAGGGSDSYWLYTGNALDGWNDEGNGSTIVYSSSITQAIRLFIENGKTVNNLMFYPMIRLASIQDDTYEPYAMTNRELTEKSVIKDVSGYSWDSAIDGNKDIVVKRYGAIVSVYGYFRTTNALAQYANILSGLPHCASGASLSADIAHNMGMTLQNVDSATSKFVVNAATTANLQYAFNFVYLTDK